MNADANPATILAATITLRSSSPEAPGARTESKREEQLLAAGSFVAFRMPRGVSGRALRTSAVCLLLLPLLLTGCTKQAKKIRHLSNAKRDFAAGQYEKAEIEYRRVLQADPANATAISQLGVIYHDEGRFPQALGFLKKAVELTPDNSDLRLKLCLTELSLGDLKGARQDAERVLQKQPGQDDALLVLAETTLSTTNVQDTIQQITKMRQQDKDRPGYHLALATLYLRQGQITNVEESLLAAQRHEQCQRRLQSRRRTFSPTFFQAREIRRFQIQNRLG